MFMGHAIGNWDGDTLVGETIGLKGYEETWLDTASHPHTDALRVVERIRRIDHACRITGSGRNPGHLRVEIDLLFDDPKTYTQPWKAKKVFQLRPTWEILENHICEEHFRRDHLPEILRP